MTPTEITHAHFHRMFDKWAEVSQWVENAYDTLCEAEMKELAKRFPKRRIEFYSGMGDTQIVIKGRNGGKDYNYSGPMAWNNWPDRLEHPAPDLWCAIEFYQDNFSDGKDPGNGVIFYENGKRIKGLAAGGA